MYDAPNYADYSLEELIDARKHIDETAFPDRVKTLEVFLMKRKKEYAEAQLVSSSSPMVVAQSTKVPSPLKIGIITVVALAAIIGGIFFARGAFDYGRSISKSYLELAQANGISCSYYAILKSTKVGVSQVQVACELTGSVVQEIQSSLFGSASELKALINKRLITPNLPGAPDGDMKLVVIILINENDVLCTSIRNGKIVDSEFDTYENYCAP